MPKALAMQGKTAVPPSMKVTYTILTYNINILIRNFNISPSWQCWYFVPAWVGGIQEAPSQVGGHNRWKLIIYRKPKWMLVRVVEIKIFICWQPGGWRGRGKTNASEESPLVRTANTENKKNVVRIVHSYFSHPDSVEVRRGEVVQVIDVQQLLLKLFFF